MIKQLVCDLCKNDHTHNMDTIAQLQEAFRIPGQVEHVCQNCIKKVDERLQQIKANFEPEIADALRLWLEEASKDPKKYGIKPKKGAILT